MSWHVVSWLMEWSPARGFDRTVALVLGDHAHKDGTGAHPSVETIAFEARCSKRAAQYALGSLEVGGVIEHTGWHPSGTKEWRVLMTDAAACHCDREQLRKNPAKCACSARFPDRRTPRGGANVAPHERVAQVAPGGRNTAQQGVQTSTDPVSQVAPEPSVNQHGTALEPPTRALAHAREGEGGEAPVIVIARGTSPKTAERLRRTAARTGARVQDESSPRPRRSA